jgi:hypothetical protein
MSYFEDRKNLESLLRGIKDTIKSQVPPKSEHTVKERAIEDYLKLFGIKYTKTKMYHHGVSVRCVKATSFNKQIYLLNEKVKKPFLSEVKTREMLDDCQLFVIVSSRTNDYANVFFIPIMDGKTLKH